MKFVAEDGQVVTIGGEAPGTATATASERSAWAKCVDRFGVTMASGLVAVIGASVVAYNVGITPVEEASLIQLLFVIVILGCMTVLVLRKPRTDS